MKHLKLFVIFGLCLLMSTSVFADEKRVHLFPLVSDNSVVLLKNLFSKELKDNLIKTGLFTISDVENFDFKTEQSENLFEIIRNEIKNKYSNAGMDLVVFGYFFKKVHQFDVRIVLYSLKSNKIVADYSEYIYSEDAIKKHAENCAILYGAKIQRKKGDNLLLSSLILPGLGHFKMKKYLKSAIYFGGTAFFIYKHFSAGKEKTEINPGFFRIQEFEDAPSLYFIESVIVTEEEYLRRMAINNVNHDYNEDLNQKKSLYVFVAGLFYAVNFVDALLTTSSIYGRRPVEKKVRLSVVPAGKTSYVCLSFHF